MVHERLRTMRTVERERGPQADTGARRARGEAVSAFPEKQRQPLASHAEVCTRAPSAALARAAAPCSGTLYARFPAAVPVLPLLPRLGLSLN